MAVEPTIAAIQVSDTKVLDILVRDDLTGLVDFRAYAHYGVEAISP